MKDRCFSIFAFAAQRAISLACFLVIGCAVFFSLTGSAKMQSAAPDEKQPVIDSSNQNLTLGKLSFARTTFTFGAPFNTLYTANADGTDQAGLTQYPPYAPTTSTWSPDGTRIAFTDTFDISSINLNGGSTVNLTNTALSSLERNPSWSVTGKIAYERDNQIWTMNADGSNQAAFSAITRSAPTAPAWSPDGSKLAFTSSGEIYVINADGTNERPVTNNSTVDANPDWSPDASKIVFSRTGSGIAVINLDGTNETGLTTNDDREPVWSQDGTKIAFVRKGTAVNGIYLMDINGANQQRIIADDQTSRGNENNSPAWQPLQPAIQRTQFDFDGDGRADLGVFRPADQIWYLLRSSAGFNATQFGVSTDKIAPADFDGDGKTDLAVFRNGTWYWLNSSNNAVGVVQFGQIGDLPVPADFSGDGHAELAVYRAGVWYLLNLANNQFQTAQFGISTDRPVAADFDGDGRTDLAVYRDGVWYLQQSTAGLRTLSWGVTADKPVAVDYDGDSKADVAIYRPSSGEWYILQSSNNQFRYAQWGISTDIAAPADYDGDGKSDVAVFRDGTWYLLQSQQGVRIDQFGTGGDQPLPAAFVP